MLVAVHPWDVDGAARAGLRTAWIDRGGSRYPTHLLAPELTATSITDLARQLTA
jgi:2-haloacid dehalogenase